MAAVVSKLMIDGVYTSYPLYEAEGIEIQVGPDIDLQLDPSTCKCTWQNPTLDLDPSNPLSALYGKIGRNTKMRIDLGPTPSTVFAGEIATWEPDETQNATSTRGRRWVSTEASGVSRRLGKWDDILDSALFRQNSAVGSLIGYWPAEGGGSDTKQLSEVSSARGAAAGSVSGSVTFGGDPGPGGGDTALTIDTGAKLAARFGRVTSSGWQFVFHAKLKTAPTSGTSLPLFGANLSNGNRVEWQTNNASFTIVVYDPTGAVKANLVTGWGSIDVTKWLRFRLKSTISGGTVTLDASWYAQDDPVIWGNSITYADAGTGALLNWQINGNAWTAGAAYGHVLATSDPTVDLISNADFVSAFNGYLGETAGARADRLMREQGESLLFIGSTADTPRMGRQKPDTLLKLLEQCRETDGGLLFDFAASGQVCFRTRRSMINQSVQLALTKGTNVAPPLKPVIGDQFVLNDVTVNNFDGTSARLVTTSGRMSVQPPPAGAGRYKKQLDVNLSNPLALIDRGNWEINVGTSDRRWYKQIVVDLLATPALIDTMINLWPGDLVTLAGAEPDTVKLIFLRALWSIQGAPVKVTLTCVPADGYDVGVYDATGTRKDATFSTLAATATSAATSISVTNPVLADCWSTTATPYDIKIEGERMTVTAATAPAGTGPYTQTLTVTRAVNGVTKAHNTIGAAVNLAQQVHYA